jgi:hypothetical protein
VNASQNCTQSDNIDSDDNIDYVDVIVGITLDLDLQEDHPNGYDG